MNSFYKQIWVAFKIWLIAVSIDTIVGALFMTAGFSGGGGVAIEYIGMYASLSAMFSFPIFLALIFIINRCRANEVASHRAFLVVLLSGIGLTILIYAVFVSMIGRFDKVFLGHFLIALLSAFAAISLQYRSILKIVDV